MAKESASEGCPAMFSPMGTEVFNLLCQGRDIIVHNVFEPGVIEVFCKGILERPWTTNNKFRLVIAANHFYVSEIVTVMKALSKGHCVQVEACRSAKHLNLISSHTKVVVMPFHLECNEMRKVLLFVNMVVFYWGNEMRLYESSWDEMNTFTSMVEILKENNRCNVQVAIFSETELIKSHREFKSLLRNPEVISSKSEINNTLGCIQNHQFIVVSREVDKVDSICKIIVDKRLSGDKSNTLIYVEFCNVYDRLIKRLREYGISTTKAGMSKEEIDSTVKEFLGRTHVLVTPRVWAREMISSIGDKVDVILNYSIGKTGEYFLRMYLFKKLRTAITLVSEAKLKIRYFGGFELVDIQSRYDCVFKRLTMPCQIGQSEAFHFLAEQVKRPPTMVKSMALHYVKVVRENIQKFDDFSHFIPNLKMSRISVIFVNDPGSMKRVFMCLNERMQEDELDLICITPDNCAERITWGEKPLVFICGVGTDKFLEVLNSCGIITDDVRILINIDFPSSTSEYIDRIECCDINGVVINFGTGTDLLDLFNMQVQLSLRFVNTDYIPWETVEDYKDDIEDDEFLLEERKG